jgi:hypothetical protein
MEDGRIDFVLLWEARAMSEQNLLVSAGSAPAGSAAAPSNLSSKCCEYGLRFPRDQRAGAIWRRTALNNEHSLPEP